MAPGRQLCRGGVGCSFPQCPSIPAHHSGCHLLGVRAFPPVLSCRAREELCEKWGHTLLSNLSCLDQYLQPESDFNKRTLSQLSYLHDR